MQAKYSRIVAAAQARFAAGLSRAGRSPPKLTQRSTPNASKAQLAELQAAVHRRLERRLRVVRVRAAEVLLVAGRELRPACRRGWCRRDARARRWRRRSPAARRPRRPRPCASPFMKPPRNASPTPVGSSMRSGVTAGTSTRRARVSTEQPFSPRVIDQQPRPAAGRPLRPCPVFCRSSSNS